MEKKSRRSWTVDQKQALVAEASRRLRSGERMREVCESLDVLEGSLRLWMRQFPSDQFLPVKLKPSLDRDAGDAREIGSGTISLTTPSGFRFDALDVGDVAVLLEQLR